MCITRPDLRRATVGRGGGLGSERRGRRYHRANRKSRNAELMMVRRVESEGRGHSGRV